MNHYQIYFFPDEDKDRLYGFSMASSCFFRDSLNLNARVLILPEKHPQPERVKALAVECRDDLVSKIIEQAEEKGIDTERLVFPEELTGFPPSGHLVWFEKGLDGKPHMFEEAVPVDNCYVMYNASETLLVSEPIPEHVLPGTELAQTFEKCCYERLKAALLRQAKAKGIGEEEITFSDPDFVTKFFQPLVK